MESGKTKAISINCKNCGNIFVMGDREMEWYTQKMGYPIPKCCPACRKRRKQKEVVTNV